MINLAGVKEADHYIYTELVVAGIDVVGHPRRPQDHPEVPYSLTGKLGDMTFTRNWYYWVVRCEVPLAIAQKIHKENRARELCIRVAGHCMDPDPEDWAEPLIPKNEIEALIERVTVAEDLTWEQIHETLEEKYKDHPKFVKSYHIDTQEGLNTFVRIVKAHNLHNIERKEGFI